jgi:L-rhamnose mutarotase
VTQTLIVFDKTQTKFEEFHKRNPHVYDMMVSLARKVKDAGKHKYSIWAVANRVRWHYEFERDKGEQFKLSNDYLSRYSRLIMQREQDLRGFFQTKPLKRETTIH